MSVYVDDFRAPYRGMVMCHMIADSLEELHAMADAIGIKRKWFQQSNGGIPHYDICRTKRALAVKNGAVEIRWRDLPAIARRNTPTAETSNEGKE